MSVCTHIECTVFMAVRREHQISLDWSYLSVSPLHVLLYTDLFSMANYLIQTFGFFFFLRQGLLNPKQALNHCEVTYDFEFLFFSASTSQILGLEACTAMLGLCAYWR